MNFENKGIEPGSTPLWDMLRDVADYSAAVSSAGAASSVVTNSV